MGFSGLKVYFHSAMKHENDVSNVVWLSPSCDNLQYALRILSFSKFLRLKIIIYKWNKICCPCIHSLLKTSAKFVRVLEHVKTLDCVSGFHWSALEFSQKFASVFTRLWGNGKHVLFLKSTSRHVIFCLLYTHWWNTKTTTTTTIFLARLK